jgi:hypothetical protein
LGGDVRQRVQSVAFDGTSSTALLLDRRDGSVLAAPKLYNEGQPDAAVAAVHVRDSGFIRVDVKASGFHQLLLT